MNKASWIDRLRYGFDKYISRGTVALVSGLAVVTVSRIFSDTAFMQYSLFSIDLQF